MDWRSGKTDFLAGFVGAVQPRVAFVEEFGVDALVFTLKALDPSAQGAPRFAAHPAGFA